MIAYIEITLLNLNWLLLLYRSLSLVCRTEVTDQARQMRIRGCWRVCSVTSSSATVQATSFFKTTSTPPPPVYIAEIMMNSWCWWNSKGNANNQFQWYWWMNYEKCQGVYRLRCIILTRWSLIMIMCILSIISVFK